MKWKPYFRDEVERNVLGAKPLEGLLWKLKPKKWFAAHMHVAFEATVPHTGTDEKTEFLALDKCLPKREFLRVKSECMLDVFIIFRLLIFPVKMNQEF